MRDGGSLWARRVLLRWTVRLQIQDNEVVCLRWARARQDPLASAFGPYLAPNVKETTDIQSEQLQY